MEGGEGAMERLVRRWKEVQVEAEELAREVVKQWERVETVAGALEMCQKLLKEGPSEETEHVGRQVWRWRRERGLLEERGWLEVRTVKGYGPYVYYRWRKAGERKIQTDYYGRADQVVRELADDVAEKRVPRRKEE